MNSDSIKHKVQIEFVSYDVKIEVLFVENIKFVARMQLEGFEEDYILINELSSENLEQLFNIIIERFVAKLGINSIEDLLRGTDIVMDYSAAEAEAVRIAMLKESIQIWQTEKFIAEYSGGSARTLKEFVDEMYSKRLIDEMQYSEAYVYGYITIAGEKIVLEEVEVTEESIRNQIDEMYISP